jgi:hypothetical protein
METSGQRQAGSGARTQQAQGGAKAQDPGKPQAQQGGQSGPSPQMGGGTITDWASI